jgi:hypothetical protein
MNNIKIDFDGTYNTICPKDNNIKAGSINCCGHNELNIKPCPFLKTFNEHLIYFPIIKENIPIIKEITCSYQPSQLKLFL